jgi:GGDEF domain-containing protein
VFASTFTIGETPVRITVSIGITEYTAQMDVEGTLLMSHARAALAQAHNSGGNMILIAE